MQATPSSATPDALKVDEQSKAEFYDQAIGCGAIQPEPRAYPQEGGATEKLDYLAEQIPVSPPKAGAEVQFNISVSLKQMPGGKPYAAGFQVSTTS